MENTMTPSAITITAGQIGKIQDLLGVALRKSGLPRDAVQHVIENQGDVLAADFLAEVRELVEAITGFLVRHVKVDRARTPQAVLQATGRKQYVTDTVVESMPHGEGEEADVYFFKLGRSISDADLDKEYELRGLKPADPYSLAAVNEDDPAFADENPNNTHWKDADGKWCYAAFGWWFDERGVCVNRDGFVWLGDWWFAGLRK